MVPADRCCSGSMTSNSASISSARASAVGASWRPSARRGPTLAIRERCRRRTSPEKRPAAGPSSNDGFATSSSLRSSSLRSSCFRSSNFRSSRLRNRRLGRRAWGRRGRRHRADSSHHRRGWSLSSRTPPEVLNGVSMRSTTSSGRRLDRERERARARERESNGLQTVKPKRQRSVGTPTAYLVCTGTGPGNESGRVVSSRMGCRTLCGPRHYARVSAWVVGCMHVSEPDQVTMRLSRVQGPGHASGSSAGSGALRGVDCRIARIGHHRPQPVRHEPTHRTTAQAGEPSENFMQNFNPVTGNA